MAMRTEALKHLDVPVIVYLAERTLATAEIMKLVPGSSIEMSKQADKDLDLYISNRLIGTGSAVKVGENFGLQVKPIESPSERLDAAVDA